MMMNHCMEGIKVIDFGQFMAIPAAAGMLGDWGADVIKVEPPGVGDGARGIKFFGAGGNIVIDNDIVFPFEVVNRNKRGITLNLKVEQGREIMYELIRESDVFMSSFQPENLMKFGLDYEEVRRINPKIIYATLTGYGDKGPKKDRPGYDYAAYWANSGPMYKLSDPDGLPVMQRPGMGDAITSMCIVSGISAALYNREKTGEAQKLSFSLYNTAIWTLMVDMQCALFTGGELPYSKANKTANPLWNAYKTKDGRWIALTMLQSDLFWPRFCQATGLTELEHDHRFESYDKRAENPEVLISIISEALLNKSIDEWEEIFDQLELSYARVQNICEVVNDPQAIANDFFMEFDHPVLNQTRIVASPVLFNEQRPSIRLAAPELGQHTEEILLELGHNWDDIVKFRDSGVI